MLKSTEINDKNKQIDTYEYESISAYNDKMNSNYDYEEHEINKWNKADILKLIKDSVIGLIAIIVLTMAVAAFRFAFVAKVDKAYIWSYTKEYPLLVVGWIVALWILWIIINVLYRLFKFRKVNFEYFTVDQMRALQKKNKKNKTNEHEGMIEDKASERYQDIKVIGYVRLGKKFKQYNGEKATNILEIPTEEKDKEGNVVYEQFNIFEGKHSGKRTGYIKVDEDKYVAIVEKPLYPFVIAGLTTTTIIATVVTSGITPPTTDKDGNTVISEDMQRLTQTTDEEGSKNETLYLWIPAFSSKVEISESNKILPLRNFSENQFRDDMWGKAEQYREDLKKNPGLYDRSNLLSKFSTTYLTLSTEEINNCLDYIWGETDEIKRETNENQFSFRYDVIVDKATADIMNFDTEAIPEAAKEGLRADEVCVFSTYPELLPPGTQYEWDAYEAFPAAGEYTVKLRVYPYITETLEIGSPRDVITTLSINK